MCRGIFAVALIISAHSSCGLEPSTPSGGIVDNGNRPPERRKSPSDGQSVPSQDPRPSSETADYEDSAPRLLFGGRFVVEFPGGGAWRRTNELSSHTREDWTSSEGLALSFIWPAPTCDGADRGTNGSGVQLTQCHAGGMLASFETGDRVFIDSNLSVEQLNVVMNSLALAEQPAGQ